MPLPLDIVLPLTTHDVGEACKKAIEGNPDLAALVRAGKSALGPLVGRVMSDLHGRANPALVTEELKRLLGTPHSTSKFQECDECRVKPGSPVLCEDCLVRRSDLMGTGTCRPPRVCSPEAQEAAKAHDERMKNWKLPPGMRLDIVEAERPE